MVRRCGNSDVSSAGQVVLESSHLALFYLLLNLLNLLLYVLDLNAVLADVETQAGIDAHVLVGDPDQGKSADQVAAPVIEQELVACDEEKQNGYVVTEAEFAGEEEIEFAAEIKLVVFTLAGAVLARLAEDLFVGHRPGN